MPNSLLQARFVVLIVGIVGILAALAGCESVHRSELLAHNEPLRPESMRPWSELEFKGQPSLKFAFDRLVLIFDGVDELKAVITGPHKAAVLALRNGRETGAGAASAVALTRDGYFLTAAHCVESTPFMIVARDSTGVVRESPGRVVWSGPPDGDLEDIAIVHAAGFDMLPVRWAAANDLQMGSLVLGAGGLSTTSIPLVGGRISGTPTPIKGTSSLLVPLSMPLVPGDSGGPIFAADGALVGVMVSADWQFPMTSASGSAIHPDPETVAGVIERDRMEVRKSAKHEPAPKAAESPAGDLMLNAGMLRLDRALRPPALSP